MAAGNVVPAGYRGRMGTLRPLSQRIAVARMQGIAARHSPLCAAEMAAKQHGDAVKAAVEEIRGCRRGRWARPGPTPRTAR